MSPNEKTLEQVLSIARERAQILENLRRALLAGDDREIRRFASQICGLADESH